MLTELRRKLHRRMWWFCDGDHYDPRFVRKWRRCKECGQSEADEQAERARIKAMGGNWSLLDERTM